MAEKKIPIEAVEAPATKPALQLAREAGLMPETIPHVHPRRGIKLNPEAWKYAAAKLRFRMTDDEQLSIDEFNQRIAAVAVVLVR